MTTAPPKPDPSGIRMPRLSPILRRFQNERSQARRFHADTIGKGVNPERSFADFLLLVKQARQTKTNEGRSTAMLLLEKRYGSVYEKASLGSSSGPSGGYLVPPELDYAIMETVEEVALFRQFSRVQPMSSDYLDLPYPDPSTAPAKAGIPPWFGTFNMQWNGVGVSPLESEPAWRQIELRAWLLNGNAYASNQLLNDAAALESWLYELFAHAVAWFEDYAFFQGTGLGQPTGLIGANATIQVGRGTPSTVALADIGSMSGDLMPSSWPYAIWTVHPSVLPQLVTLGGTPPSYQINQPMVDRDDRRGGIRPYAVLNGLPLYVSEKLSYLGQLGDVLLFDPRLYIIGDRLGLMVDFSDQDPNTFGHDQSTFRVLKRTDGQPQIANSITLVQTGGQTKQVVSPYVVLK